MKVWITKYALTSGIMEKEVERSERFPDMVTTDERYSQTFHGEGKDWHRSLDAANARAEKMRQKKISSLETQLGRLRALTF